MARGKLAGGFLCLIAVSLTVVFLWGLATQAYWALAVPIAAGVVVVMSLLFWVGWTFMTTESAAQDSPMGERPESSR